MPEVLRFLLLRSKNEADWRFGGSVLQVEHEKWVNQNAILRRKFLYLLRMRAFSFSVAPAAAADENPAYSLLDFGFDSVVSGGWMQSTRLSRLEPPLRNEPTVESKCPTGIGNGLSRLRKRWQPSKQKQSSQTWTCTVQKERVALKWNFEAYFKCKFRDDYWKINKLIQNKQTANYEINFKLYKY